MHWLQVSHEKARFEKVASDLRKTLDVDDDDSKTADTVVSKSPPPTTVHETVDDSKHTSDRKKLEDALNDFRRGSKP